MAYDTTALITALEADLGPSRADIIEDTINISVSNVDNTSQTDATFNAIIDAYVVGTYPTRITFHNEGGSIKAVYSK